MEKVMGIRIVGRKDALDRIKQFIDSLNDSSVIVREWGTVQAEMEVRHMISEWEKDNGSNHD
jgi:hypothetical protein